jgi:hypothetical protein
MGGENRLDANGVERGGNSGAIDPGSREFFQLARP